MDEEIRKLLYEEFPSATHISVFDTDSVNSNYTLHRPEGRFLVKIGELNTDWTDAAIQLQNQASLQDIAPENRLYQHIGEKTIMCNEFADAHTHIESNEFSEVGYHRIGRILGTTARQLHDIETEATGFGRLEGQNLSGRFATHDEFIEGLLHKYHSKFHESPSELSEETFNRTLELFRGCSWSPVSETVVHLPDYTTSNVLLDLDTESALIVDWDWISRYSRLFALTGIWYRMIRYYDVESSAMDNCWNGLLDGYYGDEGKWELKSEEVQRYVLLCMLDEIAVFYGWARKMTDTEKQKQIKDIETRLDTVEEQLF